MLNAQFSIPSRYSVKFLMLSFILLTSLSQLSAQPYTYYLDVLTEGFEDSGTDDPVWIYIESAEEDIQKLDDPKRRSIAWELDNPDRDDLERGQMDHFKITWPYDIGRIGGARLVLHHGDDGPSMTNFNKIDDDWEFAQIKVYGPSDPRFPNWTKANPGHPDAGSALYDLYTYESGGWVLPHIYSNTQNVGMDQRTREDWFEVMDKPIHGMQDLITRRLPYGYFVNILTDEEDESGTDDDIYITLVGESGRTLRAHLDNSDEDDLEEGEWSYFKFKSEENLGRITNIRLQHTGDDGWRPKMVYVLGPSDPLYPRWRKEGAGPRDNSSRKHDFYRFDPRPHFLDDGASLGLELDEEGKRALAQVNPNHYEDWSRNSKKWLYIKSFKMIAPSGGVNDAVRAAGQIGGFFAQAGIESVPYAGETVGPVVVQVVKGLSGNDDWGGVGEGLVDAIDGIFNGEDDFYYKINGDDINTDGDNKATHLEKNETLVVDRTLRLNNFVKLELMEEDKISGDDLLGGLLFNPSMPETESVGGEHAFIASTDQNSIYEVTYYILRCPNASSQPNISIRNGRATCEVSFPSKLRGTIALMDGRDKYLSVDPDDDNSRIITNRRDKGKFTVEDLGNGQIALKASNGRYVAAILNEEGNKIAAKSTRIGAWERFLVEDLGNDQIALKAANGRYVNSYYGNPMFSSEEEDLAASSKTIHGGSRFSIIAIKPLLSGTIALKAENGRYVAAMLNNNAEVTAQSTRIGDWGQFTVENLGNRQIALKASNGRYVAAMLNKEGKVTAQSTRIGDWGRFTVEDLGNGRIVLKAANGKYLRFSPNESALYAKATYTNEKGTIFTTEPVKPLLSGTIGLKAENGRYVAAMLNANAEVTAQGTRFGDWAQFTVENLGNRQIALKAYNGRYVAAMLNKQGKVTAESTRIGDWGRFTVEDLGNGRIALKAANGKYLRFSPNEPALYAKAAAPGEKGTVFIIESAE